MKDFGEENGLFDADRPAARSETERSGSTGDDLIELLDEGGGAQGFQIDEDADALAPPARRKLDIEDELDDSLARSLEESRQGPWTNPDARFVDPNVQRIEEALKAKPKARSYRERRLEEMRNGTAARPKPVTATAKHADAARAPATAAAPARPALASRLAPYSATLLAASVVFAAAAAVHGVLLGWQLSTLLRATLAAGVCGFAWRRFRRGRGLAMLVGAAAHLALLAPWSLLGQAETTFTTFVSLLVVVAGSGLLGLQDEDPAAPLT